MNRLLLLKIFLITTVAAGDPEKDVNIEAVTPPVVHGEGPFWYTEEQALYWVDISEGDIWRYHPETKNITTCHIDGEVTVIIPLKEDNKFVVGIGGNLTLMKWDGRNDSEIELNDIVSFGPLPEGGRLNDGKVDSNGRLWIGTIGPEVNDTVDEGKAALYKIGCEDSKIEAILQVANVSVSNGIAWSADGAIMYYVDSPTRKIDAFDFDTEAGTISNRRTVFDMAQFNIDGVPDGMTIDADDNLWVALYGGEGVMVIQPHLGRLIKIHKITGAPKVTSVAWGGANLDVVYVTTSSRGGGPGGEVYKMTNTGAHGYPANLFQLPNCTTTK